MISIDEKKSENEKKEARESISSPIFGKDISKLSVFPNEEEVLFSFENQFICQSVEPSKQDNKKWEIVLEIKPFVKPKMAKSMDLYTNLLYICKVNNCKCPFYEGIVDDDATCSKCCHHIEMHRSGDIHIRDQIIREKRIRHYEHNFPTNCRCKGFVGSKWNPNKCKDCAHWKGMHVRGQQ